MPAYGKKLTPAEVDALVDYLATLHPKNIPPARDPDKPLNKLPRDFAVISPAAPLSR